MNIICICINDNLFSAAKAVLRMQATDFECDGGSVMLTAPVEADGRFMS